MTVFLDTDICIFALRGQHPQLIDAFRALTPDRIRIPAIVAGELWLGARKSASPSTAQKAVAAFLAPYEIVPFDAHTAEVYADIREELESKGTPIGPNDLLIAATALAHRGVLVTHNTREFGRIQGLRMQDWTQKAKGADK